MNKTHNIKKSVLLLFLISFQLVLNGQTRNHLPYSMFGIGELSTKGLGRNLSMGKTGIALASDIYLNNLNPASNFLMDSISFFFDVGLAGDFVNYRTNMIKQSGNDININNVALGFRINRYWSAGIGIIPYSTVGYEVHDQKFVLGSFDKYFIISSGLGGLNQFYWDNSFHILKNLSVGVSVKYLFGQISHTEETIYSKINSQLIYDQSSYFNKLIADFGFQYRQVLNDRMTLMVGGIYGNTHKLDYKQDVTITDQYGNVIEDVSAATGSFTYPYYFGGGIALDYDNKITITGDYIYQHWDESRPTNPGFRYVNTNKLRFGIEYIPGGYRITDSYFGMIHYRAGFFSEQSYFEIDRNQPSDRGITLGISMPFLRDKSSVNVAVIAGKSGTTENGLIRENYVKVFLSFEFHDWWFLKPRYD